MKDEADFQLLTELDTCLSFKIPGAEFSKAFKGWVDKAGKFQRWDGIRRILTTNLEFPTGLVSRVVAFYEARGGVVEVVDARPPITIKTPFNLAPGLKKLGIEPYQYQTDVLDAVALHNRGIIKSATGSGKSLIAALITAQINKPTAIYVVGKDILYQFYNLFSSLFGKDRVGIVGDGHCDIKEINIISVWTAGQALGIKKNELLIESEASEEALNLDKKQDILDMISIARLNILDECHMAACVTIGKIFQCAEKSEHMYGLSGSPWRDDNADLLIEGMLGKYIVDIPASYLIERGYLAKPIIKFVETPPLTFKPPNNYQSIYKTYIVDNPVRNNLILKSTKILVDSGYQTLVLFNSIAHGKKLYELICPIIPCEILDGSDNQEKRDQVKEKITSGKLRCILASRIFDIGVDLPSLSGLVITSAGKSTVKAIQRIGRVIRKYPNKNHAAIVDFADNCKWLDKHSKIRYKVYKSEDGFDVSWIKKK